MEGSCLLLANTTTTGASVASVDSKTRGQDLSIKNEG